MKHLALITLLVTTVGIVFASDVVAADSETDVWIFSGQSNMGAIGGAAKQAVGRWLRHRAGSTSRSTWPPRGDLSKRGSTPSIVTTECGNLWKVKSHRPEKRDTTSEVSFGTWESRTLAPLRASIKTNLLS